jgi:hypothetical protein
VIKIPPLIKLELALETIDDNESKKQHMRGRQSHLLSKPPNLHLFSWRSRQKEDIVGKERHEIASDVRHSSKPASGNRQVWVKGC